VIACKMQRSKAVHEGLLLWLTEQQNQFIAAQQQSITTNTSTTAGSGKAKKLPKKQKKGCWHEGFNPADLPLPDAVALPHEPSPLAAAAREGIVIDAAAAAAGGITGPYLESSAGSKSPSTHHPFMSATPTKPVKTAANSSSSDASSAAAASGGILTNKSSSAGDVEAATAGADCGDTVAQQVQAGEVARAAVAVHSGFLEVLNSDTGATTASSSAAAASVSSSSNVDTATAAGGGDAVEFDASKLIAHLKSLPFYKVSNLLVIQRILTSVMREISLRSVHVAMQDAAVTPCL
jgi:hypothetical protein